ncbi:cardiolipin synthase [Caulifigura coniformis]|uniref:cardiolipin synthase n=1 Tax=Caulifigura coniformis TaxID=2527983 RepID=UPI001E3C9000|nr:cardiolipin synthase [Caulifigura coniformis]
MLQRNTLGERCFDVGGNCDGALGQICAATPAEAERSVITLGTPAPGLARWSLVFHNWNAILGLLFGYGLTLLLVRWVILTRRRQPASTVAWILAIALLPYVGGLLFLFFGINRVERRKKRRREARKSMHGRMPALHTITLEDPPLSEFPQQIHRMVRLAARLDDTVVTGDNQIEVFNDTNIILRRIEEAILAAKHSIHLEYYIWQPDKTGLRLRDLLIQKAREGVKVRFLYDGLGSIFLTRTFMKPLRESGAQTAVFIPGRSLRERWSFNLRSHRKIVVVDGKVGLTGGMNIGEEYLGRNRRLGYWRDTHLLMRGSSVSQLQQVFTEDWFYATGEEIQGPHEFPPPVVAGSTAAQVMSGGPDGDLREFHSLMFGAINDAQREVLLTTSYFVPTDALLAALCTAAARGVRVQLIVPMKSDHRFVVLAGRSYYDQLLEAGVEIHEYKRGIMHSKTLVIDACWSLVGSPNFDPRSLLLNFEVGVIMYDLEIARVLREHFETDLGYCRTIHRHEFERRPLRSVFAENVCRLFSPVL